LAGSAWRSTHAAPHAVSGALHEVAHVPTAHACPWLHTWPHAPQLAGSVWRFTQVAPHGVVPAPQVAVLPSLLHAAASAANAATSDARTMPACIGEVLMAAPPSLREAAGGRAR
jgi:hypothetical protein